MAGFLAPLMLVGLAAVSIPPIIHLLNRRRFEVVEWGAMQFLQISETTRRRLLIEELLLMALRMGLIAIMVLAMAAPYLASQLFPSAGARPNRDVVLVFDGSASMSFTGTGKSAHDTAKEWAQSFVNDLSAGDSVSILQAKQQVIPVLGEPTHDLERVRTAIERLGAPSGGANWPAAVEAARKILLSDKSQRPHRDIILLTDGQKYGWADEDTLLGWDGLASKIRGDKSTAQPRLAVVHLDAQRPEDPPNWSLAPIQASRAVAAVDWNVAFKTGFLLRGQDAYHPPHKIRLEIDGKFDHDLPAPAKDKLAKGVVPLTFTHKFNTPGSHLVSVIVEPDPPPDLRGPGYVVKDHLPADNRQDYAIEVVSALPVLIVDGQERATAPPDERALDRGPSFMRKALVFKGEPPVVLLETVPASKFDASWLSRDLGKEPGSKARVLILFDVPRLSRAQQEAVTQFLNDGGGVLVTLGERVDARAYNDQLHRAGEGWLPAPLGEIEGDPTSPNTAAGPACETFFHPALEIFRPETERSLAEQFEKVRFPRWWKLTPPTRGSQSLTVGQLSTKDPLMIERPFGAGRVLMMPVPLDESFGRDLTASPAFPALLHGVVYYLAGASASRHNLRAGQPLRYQPETPIPPAAVTVLPPQGEPKTFNVDRWPFEYADTREVGVYRLEAGGKTIYYVVQPDPRESILTPAKPEDLAKVKEKVALDYFPAEERERLNLALASTDARQELWLWFLMAVIALLCGEVWLTRRIALNR